MDHKSYSSMRECYDYCCCNKAQRCDNGQCAKCIHTDWNAWTWKRRRKRFYSHDNHLSKGIFPSRAHMRFFPLYLLGEGSGGHWYPERKKEMPQTKTFSCCDFLFFFCVRESSFLWVCSACQGRARKSKKWERLCCSSLKADRKWDWFVCCCCTADVDDQRRSSLFFRRNSANQMSANQSIIHSLRR